MAQRVRHKQAVEQDVSLQTSITQVNTLLETGVACISFLRGLFSEDNFQDHKLVAPRAPISSSNPPSSSQQLEDKKNAPVTVKVKKLVRGYTDEADKLLDYMEHGAADAVKKGYLHQLILAIYLDPDDPTNIVEAYTFTFSYETDAQGNRHPELVVRDQLKGMVISSSSSSTSRKSKPVKEGDAKRQVQKMIKNLITSTQALDELPRRRFVTIRLFYTPETPEDYEPPLFRPVDAENANFRITTAQLLDQPEVGTLGSMNTGFHGVTLHTVSISHLLDVPFDEHIPLAECLDRNQRSAATRNVVWDADQLVSDITDEDAKLKPVEPIGIRDDEGVVRTIEEVEKNEELRDLRLKIGMEEDEEEMMVFAGGRADGLGPASNISDNEALRRAIASTVSHPSSQGPSTQVAPVISRQKSFRPPVPLFDEQPEDYAQRSAAAASQSMSQSQSQEPSQHLATVDEDTEMAEESARREAEAGPSQDVDRRTLVQQQAEAQGFPISSMNAFSVADEDDETQLIDYTQHPGGGRGAANNAVKTKTNLATPRLAKTRSRARSEKTAPESCECGDPESDEGMVACSTCEVYKHCVCYGYEGVDDDRIPDVFTCYNCRVDLGTVDALLDPERQEEIERALADLRSLALFRRAIHTVWTDGVLNMKEISARLAIDPSTAAQIIKRLRSEQFTVEEEKPPAKSRGKGKSQGRNARSTRKGRIVVNKSPKQTRIKKETYFNPGKGAELGLTLVLESTDQDAEGEDDVLSRNSSLDRNASLNQLPPALEKVSVTTSSSSQPTDLATLHVAKPSTATSIDPPPPTPEAPAQSKSLASLSASSSSRISPLARKETLEDDPIDDFDDDEGSIQPPRVTPAQVAVTTRESAARRAAAASVAAAHQKQQSQKSVAALYIPNFSKGKGKASTSMANSAFQRASSIKMTPIAEQQVTSMDVDSSDDEPEPETTLTLPPPRQSPADRALHPVTRSSPSKNGVGKRAKDDDNEDEQTTTRSGGTVRAKRKKCSEAAEIEV